MFYSYITVGSNVVPVASVLNGHRGILLPLGGAALLSEFGPKGMLFYIQSIGYF